MSAPITFNPSAVIASAPWFERAIGQIAPAWGVSRMESRVKRHLFEYQAAQSNRIFAPKTHSTPAESYKTARDRVVMMWEARDLVENFAPAKQILLKFAENIAPSEYAPATGDRDYDRIAAEYFHDWCRVCDFEGRHSFRKLIEIAVMSRPVDGDLGTVLRRMEDGALRIQLVAGDRIGNPNQTVVADDYFSGVTVDRFGRPLSYRVYRIGRNGLYYEPEEIGRENFLHYYDPFRADQYRGVTDFHACLRTARMIKDILEAEQVGVKFASQQAALIFNSTGAPPARNLFSASPATTMANGETQKNEYTEFGALRYLQNGDKVEVMPSRPGSSFQGFTELLMEHFAMGVGVSCGVLFGTQDYKGPSVRAEFAQADRSFSRHKATLCSKLLDPIRDAVLMNAIAEGEIPLPKKLDGETSVQAVKRALRGSFRFPAKLTIDVGRESDANINENAVGAKSLQEIAAEQDRDAFERLEENAQVAAEVSRLAEKYDVPETTIRVVGKMLPSTPSAAAAAGEKVGEAAAEAQAASVAQAGAETASAETSTSKPDSESEDLSKPKMARVREALTGGKSRRSRGLNSLLNRSARLDDVRKRMGFAVRGIDEARSAFVPLGADFRQIAEDRKRLERERQETELEAVKIAEAKRITDSAKAAHELEQSKRRTKLRELVGAIKK
jgi:capsid protein